MNRIEQILKEKGISKTDFASMMGTSKQNVNAMFKNPTNAKLEEMADALNVHIWQLFASPEEVREDVNSISCPHCGGKIHFDGEPRMPDHKNIRGKEYYK